MVSRPPFLTSILLSLFMAVNRVRTDSGVGADLLVPLRHSIFRFLVHESQDVRSAAVTAAQTAFCGAMKSHRAKEDFKELHW